MKKAPPKRPTVTRLRPARRGTNQTKTMLRRGAIIAVGIAVISIAAPALSDGQIATESALVEKLPTRANEPGVRELVDAGNAAHARPSSHAGKQRRR